jgi:hypothetical protein
LRVAADQVTELHRSIELDLGLVEDGRELRQLGLRLALRCQAHQLRSGTLAADGPKTHGASCGFQALRPGSP